MSPEELEYSQAREHALQTLVFACRRFENKTSDIFKRLNEPSFSNIRLEVDRGHVLDIPKLTGELVHVMNDIVQFVNDIAELEFEFDEDEKYTPDDLRDIMYYVNKGKTLGIIWFQAFLPETLEMNKMKSMNPHFLWSTFVNENLWIRSYKQDTIFKTAKQSSSKALQDWYFANDANLLCCFDEAILSISRMRNLFVHWEESLNARVAYSVISKNKKISDPLTDLQETPINNYTLFITLGNLITGLLRSLIIFEESVIINKKGGVTKSAKNSKDYHDIVCSNCKQNDQVPFAPRAGSNILCTKCFEDEKYGLLR